MDFQNLVDGISAMACVVSVEKLEEGRHGKVCIVTGNRAYINSIEKPVPGTKVLKEVFVPNTEYTNYITRDLNFENFCYRSAVQKKCLHSYARPDRMPVWFNMTFLPVEKEDGNLCYCIYIMEINYEMDSQEMTSISGDMAARVLQTCIKMRGTNDFMITVKEVIKDIRDICGAEHCCILAADTYSRSCKVLCEAFSESTKLLPMEHYVDDKFYSIVESWEGTIAGSNCLMAKNEQDMEVVKERNPIWYESLHGAGAKTIVLFPLKSGEQLLGYMWAINFNAENAIKIKETLELTTFFLGSELGNYLLLDKLKILSSKDMLTGVMNRNEMNIYVDALANGKIAMGETAGVIFADLNGLKTVNDVEGHNFGDELLKNAAIVLKDIFDVKQIFRAGGDEFSIIVTGITQEELNAKIEAIREGSKRFDKVSFAIGGAFVEKSCDVRVALRRADEIMYADKKKYYDIYPERKYR